MSLYRFHDTLDSATKIFLMASKLAQNSVDLADEAAVADLLLADRWRSRDIDTYFEAVIEKARVYRADMVGAQ